MTTCRKLLGFDLHAFALDGEAVVTRLCAENIFPVIRYRTGDHLTSLRSGNCACGRDGLSFELKGRQNVDFVRIAGVEIRNEEIQQVVREYTEDFEDYVETVVRQDLCGMRQVVALSVKVVLQKACSDPERAIESLQQALASKLRLSSNTFLDELIAQGAFQRPEVILLPEVPLSNKRVGVKLVS